MTTLPTRSTIRFYFEPGCPWTWNTSRWLIDAAAQRDVDIAWRSFSLAVHDGGKGIPERFRAVVATGTSVHRVIQALIDADQNDLVADFYTEWGRQVHHDHVEQSADLVRKVAESAGVGRYAGAADDPSWDSAIRTSTEHAIELAGPDVGSPIMGFGDPEIGIFGPIVSPPPSGEAAARLLDHVVAAAQIPGFYELKRGRSGGVQRGPRP